MSIKISPAQNSISKPNIPNNPRKEQRFYNINAEKSIYQQPLEDSTALLFLQNQALLNRYGLANNSRTVVEEIEDNEGNICYAKYSDGTIQTFENGKPKIEIYPNHSSIGYYPNGKIKFLIETDGTTSRYNPTGRLKEITYPDGTIVNYDEDEIIGFKNNKLTAKDYNYHIYQN